MRTTRLLSTFAALALLAGLMAAPTLAAPSMQGGNLLQNPSFEQGSQGGWEWWRYENIVYNDDKKKDPNPNESFYAPDFMPSEAKWDKESGGTTGAAGTLSGKQEAKFRAGFYQTVDVAAGSKVHFSVAVNGQCVARDGTKSAVILKAGIDPDGGTNWSSANVKWAETTVGNEKYVVLTAPEVTAGAGGNVHRLVETCTEFCPLLTGHRARCACFATAFLIPFGLRRHKIRPIERLVWIGIFLLVVVVDNGFIPPPLPFPIA